MAEKETNNASFYEDNRAYLKSLLALLKLDTVEKLTQIFSSVMLILLAVILAGGALFYLSFGFVWWSQDLFGSILPGIFIISAGYLLLLALFYLFRKNWIINPLVKLFSRIFFTPTNESEDEEV